MRRPPPLATLPRYPVTGGTILLAVVVTAAWMTKSTDLSLLMTSATIQRGQLWRLMTATLPHAGLFHLAFNCYWTWTFGTLIEATWGSLVTAGVFILLGVGSMAAEFAILNGGVGLSGVGYGLFGLVWILGRRDRRFADAVDGPTINTFLVWFVICIVTTYTGLFLVANIAHGAGLALGAGLAVTVSGHWRRSSRWAAGIGVGTAMVAGLAASTVLRPYVNYSSDAARDNAYQGWVALEADRNEDAVRWLAGSTRMEPRIASTWYNLGIAYRRVHRPAESAAAYGRASELDPSNTDYRNALGRAALRLD